MGDEMTYDDYLNLLINTKYGNEMKEAIIQLFLYNQRTLADINIRVFG